MNIAIVNHYAGGPSMGMEFRPYYLAKAWSKKGNHVITIAGSYSHLRSKQPAISSNTKQRIDGVDYFWLKTNAYKGNGIKRVISMFLFCWRLFLNHKKIFHDFQPDLIIASSTYPLDVIPVVWLAKRYNALSCYEVHDLWPLSPMELGGYTRSNPFMMLLQWAENFAYKNVSFVISMLPKTLDHMMEHGLQKDKFCYIPNGIATDEWVIEKEPNAHIDLLHELRDKGKMIVGYVGGHAISNALDTLINAAALAKKENPNLVFVLIGNGTEKMRLQKEVADRGLSNVFFLEPIAKKSVPRLLSEFDMLYLGWHDNPLYRFGISPNKLIDYMMAGKPVIHSVNAANDLVKDCGCGASVPPESPAEIVRALNFVSGLTESERVIMGSRGREHILKNYNYDFLAEKFLDFAQSKR